MSCVYIIYKHNYNFLNNNNKPFIVKMADEAAAEEDSLLKVSIIIWMALMRILWKNQMRKRKCQRWTLMPAVERSG